MGGGGIDWLVVSCVASFIAAIGLGVALFVNWRNERSDPYAEPFGDCPRPEEISAARAKLVGGYRAKGAGDRTLTDHVRTHDGSDT